MKIRLQDVLIQKVPAYGQQSNYGIVIKIDNKATAHKNLFKFPEEPTQI